MTRRRGGSGRRLPWRCWSSTRVRTVVLRASPGASQRAGGRTSGQRHPICRARAAILRPGFTPRFTLRDALLALLTPSGPAIWRGRVRCAGSPVSSLWLAATTRDAGLPGQWAARSRDRACCTTGPGQARVPAGVAGVAGGGPGSGVDGRPPGPAGPDSFGSLDSQRGRYQLRSPSRAMTDGSSTPRTTVASSSTATARPDAELLEILQRQRAEDREHGDHDDGGTGHHASGGADAVRDRLLGRHPPVVRFLDPRHHEHVVVHRQAEQHHEDEQRDPGLDRPGRRACRSARRPSRAGRPRPSPRTRRPPTAG